MPESAHPDPAAREADFYCGYLPVPSGQKKFLAWAVPTLLVVVVGVGLVAARTQPDPGSAVWDDGAPRSFTGLVVTFPYPVLFADDAGDGKPGAMLLVGAGKHGTDGRVAALDGARATVTGLLLRRDACCALELDTGNAAVKPAPGSGSTERPPVRSMGKVTLKGEIVDSKCSLGAMKPGEGRTHKECATLCISGGIPPVFITRSGTGARTYFLLCNESGGPLDKDAYPFIADTVELTGQLESLGGVLRLRVRASDIHRS